MVLPPIAARLYDLAIKAQRAGQVTTAIANLEQVVKMVAGFAWAHLILADLLDGRGDSEGAIRHYRAALKADPARFEAAFNLGAVYQRQERWDDAAQCYAAVVRLRPDLLQAAVRLASMLVQARRLGEAEAVMRKVTQQAPDDPAHWRQLAAILQRRGQPCPAADCLRKACKLAPNDGELHLYLAVVLREAGNGMAALEVWQQAAALSCSSPDMDVEHGRILMNLGRLTEAENILAACAESEYAPAMIAFAHCLRFLGKFDQAEALLRQVLTTAPDDTDAQWNLGLLLLLRGEYRQGWRLYQAHRRFRPSSVKGAEWSLETPAKGRTVLVEGEQGYGDTLQFLRYADLVANTGAKVVLRVQPGLVPLLSATMPYKVTSSSEAPPRHHFHTFLLSLPDLFGTTLDSVPPIQHALCAPEPISRLWRSRLGSLPGRKIGIVWSGNQNYAENFNRAIPLKYLEVLFALPGITWVSLQKEKCPGDAETLARLPGLVDLADELDDWATTAAVLDNLDMLVTVDTGIAHLAGVMGRPVTVLLSFVPDWRWGAGATTTTPWYPAMTLLRQQSPGDWEGVCRRLADQLKSSAIP